MPATYAAGISYNYDRYDIKASSCGNEQSIRERSIVCNQVVKADGDDCIFLILLFFSVTKETQA